MTLSPTIGDLDIATQSIRSVVEVENAVVKEANYGLAELFGLFGLEHGNEVIAADMAHESASDSPARLRPRGARER